MCNRKTKVSRVAESNADQKTTSGKIFSQKERGVAFKWLIEAQILRSDFSVRVVLFRGCHHVLTMMSLNFRELLSDLK